MKHVSCTSENASISIPPETFQTAQYIVEFVLWSHVARFTTM